MPQTMPPEVIGIEHKIDALTRLRRIEGQVKGLHKMVEEERYCVDVLQQLAAVQEALRGVTKVIMRNYLETCATNALRSGDAEEARAIYDDLMRVIFKFSK
jgi:CsoR family transcriptional regulator, copper-sensing transcriptional repressor